MFAEKPKNKRQPRRYPYLVAGVLTALVVLAAAIWLTQMQSQRPALVEASPDGRYRVEYFEGLYSVTDGTRRQNINEMLLKLNDYFVDWSANSRYAIFGGKNRYGMMSLMIMDTQTWELIEPSPCDNYNMSECLAERVLATNGHLLIMADGRILDLDHEFIVVRIVKDVVGVLERAAWSPENTRLLLISRVRLVDDGTVRLYHTSGVGENPSLLSTIEANPTYYIDVQWQNEDVAILTTYSETVPTERIEYRVDLSTGAISVTRTEL